MLQSNQPIISFTSFFKDTFSFDLEGNKMGFISDGFFIISLDGKEEDLLS